jgi:hypothetical protein
MNWDSHIYHHELVKTVMVFITLGQIQSFAESHPRPRPWGLDKVRGLLCLPLILLLTLVLPSSSPLGCDAMRV